MNVLDLFGDSEPSSAPVHTPYSVFLHTLDLNPNLKTPHRWELSGSHHTLEEATVIADNCSDHVVILFNGPVVYDNAKPIRVLTTES